MADPSGLDDLEAELRRMEEELAALKGKKPEKKAKKPKEAPPSEAPAPTVATPEPAAAPKKRFGLPKFGKKGEAPVPEPIAAEPVDALAETAVVAPAPVGSPPAAAPEALAPLVAPAPISTPSGRWRREGRAWVLQNPSREPVHLRRVLDADGRVVSEGPAPPELFAPRPVERLSSYERPAPEVATEPEAGPAPDKPLHSLAEKLGAKRKKGLFGRKKGD